ncbi:hypothetical protein [Metabacillus litoralis]|uniref:hypothetical protein n=1 Tax=Metabacillus litoralis TaxID=152268 RepID=UPI001CFF3385|nr:hypothetical protein [Metabacillus litoralis]
MKNGNIIHDWDGNEVIIKREPVEYLYTTQSFGNKKDKYILNISWKDKNEKLNDTILLTPKIRYFVIPSSLF